MFTRTSFVHPSPPRATLHAQNGSQFRLDFILYSKQWRHPSIFGPSDDLAARRSGGSLIFHSIMIFDLVDLKTYSFSNILGFLQTHLHQIFGGNSARSGPLYYESTTLRQRNKLLVRIVRSTVLCSTYLCAEFKLKPPGRLNLSWNDCLESITIQITGCHAHWLPTFVRSLNYSVLHTIVIVADNKRANQALLGTKYFAELDRWYGETMARDDTLRGLRKLQVHCNFVLKTSRAVEEGRKLWFATARSACEYGIFELVEYGPPASNADPEMEM